MLRALVALVLGALVPAAAHAGPVCALLDPDKTPRAALLEAKLLADPGATWVERAAIDKVLAEQRLQALLSPQGVGERVRLGKLLKADVLVSVRPVRSVKNDGTPDHVLEVTVSETAGGLRLLVRAVPVTDRADADVAALLAVVRDGLKRHGEKIAEVVAVPPFVSQNLTFEAEHLKAAYARLAETEALARPGVLVVELAEAEALARELALTAPGTAVTRPAATYLLGEYRHAGTGKDRSVTLTLRAERGGKPVGGAVTKEVKPDEAPAAIRAWVADALKLPAGAGRSDPMAEVAQLALRASEFRRLGARAEALGLLEAALLIDPAQPELHLEAMTVTRLLLQQTGWGWKESDAKRFETGLCLHRRGLEHLETFVVKGGGPVGDTPNARIVSQLDRLTEMLTFVGWTNRNNERYQIQSAEPGAPLTGTTAEGHKRFLAFEPVRVERREVLLRVIPLVVRWERPPFGVWGIFSGVYLTTSNLPAEALLIDAAVYHLPLKERFALVEKILLQLKDVPQAEQRLEGYLAVQWHSSGRSPLFEDLLARLAAVKDEKVRTAVKSTRSYMALWAGHHARWAALNPPAPRPTDPPPADPALAKLTPIEPEFPKPKERQTLTDIVGAGPGVDVVVTGSTIFVMKEKGKLRQVWSGEAGAHTVVFDGRFVWVALAPVKGNSGLLVLDPKTEIVHEVTAKHKLPLSEPGAEPPVPGGPKYAGSRILVAVVGPGRVCLAGTVFARDSAPRVWIGTATFDPVAGPSVKVIHEARTPADKIDKLDRGKQDGADLAHTPAALVVCRRWPPAAAPELRVVLSRYNPRAESPPAPLLIDPERETVEILSPDAGTRTWVPVHFLVTADGALYEVTRRAIWKLTPDGRREEVAAGLPDLNSSLLGSRWVILHEGCLHILAEREWWVKNPENPNGEPSHHTRNEWWEFDPATNALRLLSAAAPPNARFVVTAHYGLAIAPAVGFKLSLRQFGLPKKIPYSVVLPPPAKKDVAPVRAPDAVRFTPIRLAFDPADGGAELNGKITQLHAVGPGVDVVAAGSALFVMKERGKPRRVWSGEDRFFTTVFDGRYVWVAAPRAGREPQLLVLDPIAEKIHEVTVGVPPFVPGKGIDAEFPQLRVLPLDVGRVCAAGSSLGTRVGEMWVGMATFDPVAGAKVKVVRREQGHPRALNPVTRRAPDGTTEMRVRVERNVGLLRLLDPDRQVVEELAPKEVGNWVPVSSADSPAGPGGTRYTTGKAGLLRVKTDGTTEVVSELTPISPRASVQRDRRAAFHDGRLLIVDGEYWAEPREAGEPYLLVRHWSFGWCEFDPATEELRHLSASAPPTGAIVVSSHYGLMIVGREVGAPPEPLGGTRPRLYAVERGAASAK